MKGIVYFGFLLVGSSLMFLLSFTLYSRIQKAYMRDKSDAANKRRKIILSIFMMLLMLLFTMIFNLLFADAADPMVRVFLYDFSLLFLVSVFDALFIDYFTLLIWRPKFLGLQADEVSSIYVRKHIVLQFTVGLLPLLLISLLASFGYFWLF